MYLFTRNVLHAGAPADYVANAIEMRQFVSDRTGREIALWNVQFGAPAGAMSYSMRVDGLADLAALGDQLAGDAEYHARLAAGAAFVAGPIDDHLARPINAELGDAPPVGSVAIVTTAVMAGSYTSTVGWCIDVAAHVGAVGGLPVMLLAGSFGQFGSVTWISVAADEATADEAGQKVEADAGYLAKLDAANGMFVPGASNRFLLKRIA